MLVAQPPGYGDRAVGFALILPSSSSSYWKGAGPSVGAVQTLQVEPVRVRSRVGTMTPTLSWASAVVAPTYPYANRVPLVQGPTIRLAGKRASTGAYP